MQRPACKKFFNNVPELVLEVLTYLSTYELVQAMSVCRDFYEKIRDGQEFQKALFFEAAEPVAYLIGPFTHYHEASSAQPTSSLKRTNLR